MTLPEPYYHNEAAGITIYCGRCDEVLPHINGVDLVFTSPPYNLGNTSGGGEPAARMGHYSADAPMGKARGGLGLWAAASRPGGLSGGYGIHEDAMLHDEYVAWQQATLTTLWATLSDRGAIFYNHKPRVLNGGLVTPLDYVPAELRANVRQEVIWKRSGGINFSLAFYLPMHERIVVLAKRAFRLASKGASGVGDVWTVHQEVGSAHPAPFPIGLPARAIETTPAGLVLDPFMGSGTTLRAAMNAGRKAIGIEISEEYCEIAVRRLQQSVLPLAVA